MTPELKPPKECSRVILDSNALFVPFQFKIDIFEELRVLLNMKTELILLSTIRQELGKLAEKGSPQMRKEASYALELAGKCRLIQVSEETGSSPDDVIVAMAHEWKCPVFTNDKQLRKRLRNINVPVIYVRQKSRLEIDGGCNLV